MLESSEFVYVNVNALHLAQVEIHERMMILKERQARGKMSLFLLSKL